MGSSGPQRTYASVLPSNASVESTAEVCPVGITSIGCHNLSPGMVLTDLLLKDASTVAKRFFNALAEEPETVAAALVPQMRAVQVCATHPSLSLFSLSTAMSLASGHAQVAQGHTAILSVCPRTVQ